MKRNLLWQTGLLLAAAAVSGCILRSGQPLFDGDLNHFVRQATTTEYGDVAAVDRQPVSLGSTETPPLTLADEKSIVYLDMTLEEAIRTALTNSQVLRDLGATVIHQPGAIGSAFDPSIRNTDPRFGVDAALSNFDAQWHSNIQVEKNDRPFNNQFFGGGTRLFKQDLAVFQSQLSKQAATGSTFFLRRNTEYNANNAPGNLFPSAWTTNIEAEMRQPLLQGNGVEFNRLAGPSRQVGVYNGVVLARIDTEVSVVEFQMELRNLVSNVENSYWDLYYAYRDLHAKIQARNQSLKTWHAVRGYLEAGRIEAEKEALAREQYFRLQLEVQNALSGWLYPGTHTANGSSGGTFRRNIGVQVAERRLRLIIGMPINDGRLIRPLDEPVLARAVFDWPSTSAEALMRRSELRRQRQIIRRREMELVASRNFLLPRLDSFSRYRWIGFGRDLISANGGKPQFNNAWQNLLSGQFQEFQFGFELDFPIGFRRAHAGVQQAELRLARERAVLLEQERQILHDLSNVVGEVERAYAAARTTYNQRVAAREQLAAVQAAFEGDKATADQVLDAQRRLAEVESSYALAQVEYALAVKNVHFEKGALMDYNQIVLAEGPWPGAVSGIDPHGGDGRKRSPHRRKTMSYLLERSMTADRHAEPASTTQPPTRSVLVDRAEKRSDFSTAAATAPSAAAAAMQAVQQAGFEDDGPARASVGAVVRLPAAVPDDAAAPRVSSPDLPTKLHRMPTVARE